MTTLTENQKSDRLALIKKIAERTKKLAQVKAQTAAALKSEEMKLQRELRNEKAHAKREAAKKPVVCEAKNINRYTDESKYADTYYGDTFRATTQFDNDWD